MVLTRVGLPVPPDLQEEEVPGGALGEEDLAMVGQPVPDPRGEAELLDLPDLQGEVGGGDHRVLQMMMEIAPMRILILVIANSPEISRRR